jgi:hypothetical protein
MKRSLTGLTPVVAIVLMGAIGLMCVFFILCLSSNVSPISGNRGLAFWAFINPVVGVWGARQIYFKSQPQYFPDFTHRQLLHIRPLLRKKVEW